MERCALSVVPFRKVWSILYRLRDDYFFSLVLIRQVLFSLHDLFYFIQNFVSFGLFVRFLIGAYILLNFLSLGILDGLMLVVAIILPRVIFIDDHFDVRIQLNF